MATLFNRIFAADKSVGLGVKVYHKVNFALLGVTPVAIAADNTALSFPVDMALALFFPLHGHIGMNYVLTDYVPKFIGKAYLGPARAIMVGVTGMTVLGLTKLNVEGPGITGTLRALWTTKK
mmetsp:Transcript_20952/g.62499  ORF Transcript_20952/g.62499 Transcript_20952/m.62499 type:complete len:122 (+) Transcript_20952:132-497(+)|eukprot:CAMPEP_0119264488 /NCGR_PEP_ID=MMETSP1329-20130426/3559_1 /TAXON_ID=114041 /ORGANISM="Genus nov. species nov., Strain RCC1024" /LENGTH=121 /DNA_ID=CAMNT_0007264261 /DNA_START=186 /DNA_END=551 /DNA_ORIENTATION=+